MSKIRFLEDEMQIKGSETVFGCSLNIHNTPVSAKENMKRMIEGEPVWQASTFDYQYLFPRCVPDNPAKGNVSDAKLSADELGGFDMFGIEWEYVEQVGGSTVRPGNPLLEDVNEWKSKVKFPTKEVIDSWDWEGAVQAANEQLKDDYFWEVVICTGWYERLISFMDFENAAVAMIDEDQEDAIKELFDKLSDLYIVLIDKYLECFPGKIDAVCLHDDWGHQNGIFFSPDTVREMILPYMKKVTDYVHEKGMKTECHSCGKVDRLLPCYIEAGFDMLECQPLLDFDTIVRTYGDKIKVHMPPTKVPSQDASKEEQIKSAHEYVDKIISLGNPIIMENYYSPVFPPVFTDEIYRYSRIRFSEEVNK